MRRPALSISTRNFEVPNVELVDSLSRQETSFSGFNFWARLSGASEILIRRSTALAEQVQQLSQDAFCSEESKIE